MPQVLPWRRCASRDAQDGMSVEFMGRCQSIPQEPFCGIHTYPKISYILERDATGNSSDSWHHAQT